MKKFFLLLFSISLFGNGLFAQESATDNSQISYAVGVKIANEYKNKGFDNLDAATLKKAIEDFYADKLENNMTAESAGKLVTKLAKEKQESAGKKFLADNLKTNKKVTQTASGLQYEVLQEGTGAMPTAADKVTVHYTGKLTDGSVFDSSVQRGQPATFPLGGVIRGWTEGLQLMKTGAKYRFYIPHDLAYGARGAGGAIPPYATLIFDVELISIGG